MKLKEAIKPFLALTIVEKFFVREPQVYRMTNEELTEPKYYFKMKCLPHA